MKKLLFVWSLVLLTISSIAQPVTESTVKKISLGYDIYNTFWLNMPLGVDTRTLNQGANLFAMYNHEMNDKGLSVAAGLGISSENLFLKDYYIADIHADVVEFSPLPTDLTASRSKLNFTYLDIPLELRLKTEKDVRFGLGFKFGILLDSKTFYKGDAFDEDGNWLGYVAIAKDKKINQMEKYRFGVQLRAGYKWVQVFGYYALNKVFIADKGPQMAPISVGITFMPF
ncbi:MAG: outer membrane beta-barrel protein [Bacteroidales bacterium]|nr:outer membrane beta-barrel protein [Bacteroidales bacterium]